MYMVYVRYKGKKRAQENGFSTDNLERAKDIANRERASWWGQNGVFDWIKVKDMKTGKYIYEA